MSASPSPASPSRIRAAAIQLEAEVGDVAANLGRIEALVDEAARADARLIAVPEFCTSRLPFDARAHEAVLPPNNAAVDLFRRLAARHQCWIGGSMLIAEGEAVYNRYHFVEPDGSVHCHDKDLPTMWENAFYGPGNDDGAFETQLGGVGAAVCWELIRTQTVRRLLGRVQVAITGTHWWTMPSNWGGAVDRGLASIGQYNRYLSENAPAEFARRLGAPVLQASHCGRFRTGFLVAPGLAWAPPYDTEFVGCTQIVDAQGHVLAQRRTQEGPGVVVADIDLAAVTPVQALEERFWIPELPLFLKAYWHHQNLCAKRYYRDHGRALGLASAARYRGIAR
ncbi:MAG: carbon-nitrogen hydrolase family protein [Algiphilus sp.]|uniref:carbon-nitrogen hydrolase family protein n=1 Tax=Algiphilus sp. TaxID=1872431 RepID=UPI001CA75F8F|nr:carbon-nitrogen hydrolase family protein [Algiphilus sp.]MBY8966575.1 carbon-nitrogen hydrolase family protein [Algiphilus acroporae]MCI5061979.1 carbon-nitrogen hydrolase family protein [Algiphilus sp.]MCI5103218.1 carbon-nitrogen hydrolase family protein [Algiphilus sp.]